MTPVPSSIAAVVVTYNRKVLLRDAIVSLLHQATPLERIYIIDNASTDGTQAHIQDLLQTHECLVYTRMSTNTGGAGGFSHGLKLAFSEGHDWFWLIDDDVEAYPEAIANLLQFRHVSQCIHGQRTDTDGHLFQWGGKFYPNLVGTIAKHERPSVEHNHTSVNVGCFEGMLIHRDIVEKIGFPLADLFITWDDVYYGYLASQHTDVIYASVKTLIRKRKPDLVQRGLCRGQPIISAMATYYYHRNRYILATHIQPPALTFWCWSVLFFARGILREILKHSSGAILKAVFKGTVDGMRHYLQFSKSTPSRQQTLD